MIIDENHHVLEVHRLKMIHGLMLRTVDGGHSEVNPHELGEKLCDIWMCGTQ